MAFQGQTTHRDFSLAISIAHITPYFVLNKTPLYGENLFTVLIFMLYPTFGHKT